MKINKKAPAAMLALFPAPDEIEYLNLVWRDFKKLVRFIDDNKAWLLPLLEKSRGDRGSVPNG